MAIISRSGGASGGMVKLFDSTLGVDTATIDTGANGIAAGYSSLLFHIYARTDEAIAFSNLNLTLNGDTGAHYDRTAIQNVNATVTGNNTLASTQWLITVAGANCGAGVYGAASIFLPAYAATTGEKAGTGTFGLVDTAAANALSITAAFTFRSTSAITQAAVTPNTGGSKLKAGSRFTIWGLP